MLDNPIIKAMLNRKSIRKFTNKSPSDEIINTIVRAGQQAPFVSQLCSILLSRDRDKIPYKAPLSFIFCVDSYKLELIMAKREWKLITNDLMLLILSIQDAALMGQNMVMAAESLGLGSCHIGMIPYEAEPIAKQYKLPKRIFPIVQLVMGYPAESPPPRPRYPMNFTLFEDEYPDFDEETIENAMQAMDEGYLSQDYYRKAGLMLELKGDKEETFDFDTYSWTEHISRKWGQRLESLAILQKQFEKRGFKI
ncbi:MAG: nitroreductase family protein [candidate division Zixibacteria bacterium]|nr:nitroreductase family protein [candidate division Zixibacteria bacterium]